MRTRPFLLALISIALVGLQSCGGMETIVSVYPDGSAELAYTIEAPTGKMPDLAAMGKGDLAEIFKKDQYLSQDPQKLIDSLVTFGVQPLLTRLKQSGQIRDYRITDSAEFTQKKMRIAIDLTSYSQVGKIHSAFKREIPALDSILRKLTNRPASARADSIAIVSLGDSLEMQLHHFVMEPQLVTMSREERIANGRRMIDSILNMITDPESVFSYMMGPEEKEKMMDSINILKSSASDDMLDSIGRAYQMFDNMGTEIFKPKISLRAPLMLSNNESEMSGRFSTTFKSGALQFEPSAPYGEIVPSIEPIRQRFKLALPPMRASTQEERDEWRSILRWCGECETSYENTMTKQQKASITFHPAVEGKQYIEVDCGTYKGEKAKLFYTLANIDRMPTVMVHQFSQGFYLDDPVTELRTGSSKFVTNKTDLVIGKITLSPSTQTLNIERANVKEIFDMGAGAPIFKSGSYKDKAGKWIRHEGYINNSSDLFGSTGCAEGVMLSSDAPQSLNLDLGRF